ncbi:hypothetical protein CsatB_025058 [Cannabis sativa]
MAMPLFFFFFFFFIGVSHQQPFLNSGEQESVYQVLDSINSAIPWRTLFSDDLCNSPPHGVVCDYFTEFNTTTNDSSTSETFHITELSFGYVSDFTPNPPCSENSTLSPLLFTSFKYLRKLFFYKCFNSTPVSVPNVSAIAVSNLEELVFIENPGFMGSLNSLVANLSSLKRVVLIGNGVYGEIPSGVGDLINLEELTLSRNRLSGKMPNELGKLKNLKVLDLSLNSFDGEIPTTLSNLSELIKLDLSSNGFNGRIPESCKGLEKLEFLDLSFNSFGNFGVPLFLGEMVKLKEVYLSGNKFGGKIPNIWENLEGVLRIGFSGMDLEGSIPSSMAIHLKNLSYLGLDNNKLEGIVPMEFGVLPLLNEINLENNNLSGNVYFPEKFGQKLKLGGNPKLKLFKKKTLERPYSVAIVGIGSSSSSSSSTKVFIVPSMVVNVFIGLLVLLYF